jgi:hypothetical protein
MHCNVKSKVQNNAYYFHINKCINKGDGSQVGDAHPAIPALRRLRQEDPEFDAYLGCICRHCLKTRGGEWVRTVVLSVVYQPQND